MALPLQLVFGPMLLGVFFNLILWGIMAAQTVVYFQAYQRDTLILQSFVCYLVVAETVNSIMGMGMMYNLLVTEWGSPNATTYFPRFLPADPIITVFISTPIQIFIAYRLQIISQTFLIPIVVVLLSLVSMGGGLWTAIMVKTIKVFQRKPELHTPALTWLLASAIADVTITVSLYWSLAQRKTGLKRTDDMINRILRLTVQTGLITAIFALLDVICFLALPHTTINFIWDFALSKLYTNALLSTLNARAGWSSVGGVDPHNVLFGTTMASRSDGELSEFDSRHGRMRGSGWGSTYRTNPELSFVAMSPLETGVYESDPTASFHIQNVPGSQLSQYGQRHGSVDRRSVSFAIASPSQIAEPPQFGIMEEIRETKGSHPHRFSQESNAEPNSSMVSFTRPQPTEDVPTAGLPVVRLKSDRLSTQSSLDSPDG
ncbi:hypothetical protein L218DRAFT_565509 [Marasmius fiardii PR-910]|nr:hypothetical protein L218DRAFT_565509 [Marasmius fiardii PR-910]